MLVLSARARVSVLKAENIRIHNIKYLIYWCPAMDLLTKNHVGRVLVLQHTQFRPLFLCRCNQLVAHKVLFYP